MTKANLWDEKEIEKQNKRIKYLITAGKNRYGREQYVNTYNDTDEWDISAVPIPMSKTKALQLIRKIEKEYKEKQETKNTVSRKNKVIEFNLVEYK